MAGITYRDAGVDIDAGNELVDRIKPAVRSTMRPEVLAGIGGFGSTVAIPSGYREPVLVSGTDGVGTKLKIAFAVGDHSTVGIDLVAMCANDIIVVGAEPLFFLDYYACSALEPEAAAQVVEGIAEGCRQAGCALVGGETAELPGFYQPGEYDLAGFVVGVAERQGMIDGAAAREGDAVLGLHSSGLHSNGYSLARALIDRTGIDLAEPLPGLDEPAGATFLRPTRIYVKAVRALIAELDVRALAHITGGGLLENIPRTLPEGLGVDLEAGWPVPPVFRWIAERGPVDSQEMLRTFNMGIGMSVVIPQDQVARALELVRETGLSGEIIGRVTRRKEGEGRVLVQGTV